MRKNFFGRFSPQERTQNKSISMPESDWKKLEAYRLFGSSAAGHEIPLQRMIREILMDHISRDREFSKAKDDWMSKLSQTSTQEAADA